ncbi:MAG: DUF3467 domain-containing protein [archaeon]
MESGVPSEVKIDIVNGDSFYADELAVIYNPLRFILDFKNVTPRADIRAKDFQPLVLKHNVVVLDVYTAKSLLEMLDKNVKSYEERFGKITKPAVLEKLEKEKKKRDKKNKASEKTENPNYFG